MTQRTGMKDEPVEYKHVYHDYKALHLAERARKKKKNYHLAFEPSIAVLVIFDLANVTFVATVLQKLSLFCFCLIP